MGGFYGNSFSSIGLDIVKRYSNKKAMDQGAATDGVLIGGYVIISYNLEGDYKDNLTADGNKNYDATLWQKTFSSNEYKYEFIADLNGGDIGVKLVAPSTNFVDGIVGYDSLEDGTRLLHLPAQWNINGATLDVGLAGFEQDKTYSKTKSAAATWKKSASGNYGTNNNDQLALQLTIQEIGQAISNIYDKIYGQSTGSNSRPWLKGIGQPPTSGGNIQYADGVLLSDVKKQMVSEEAEIKQKINELNTELTNLLDLMYGKANEDGNRPWEDGLDDPPVKDDGVSVLSKSNAAIKAAEKVTEDLNTLTSTFQQVEDNTIPYVKVIDGNKQFFGITLEGGDGITLEDSIDSDNNRTIKILLHDSTAIIKPFA